MSGASAAPISGPTPGNNYYEAIIQVEIIQEVTSNSEQTIKILEIWRDSLKILDEKSEKLQSKGQNMDRSLLILLNYKENTI